MKKIWLLLIPALAFVQCKKDKEDEPPPDLQRGLLAYFRLNGDFADSAKNVQTSYGGFLSNAKNRHGYNSRAMNFNGGLFSFGTDDWPATAITISLWIKPKDLNVEGYLVWSTQEAFGVYQSKSKLGLAIGIPAMGTALAEIGADWMHFAGTYDGKDIKTYINGQLATTVRHQGVPDITMLIGIGAPGIPEWMGTLDDLRFYNRVLSAKEIDVLSKI